MLIGGLLKQGPASYEIGTVIGNRLNRFRDAITKFDAAYESLLVSAELRRAPLEEVADHLSAVASVINLLQPNVRRLRAINAELNGAATAAKEILGVLWAEGEPDAEALSCARGWGVSLHNHAIACAGDDLAWLGQLRQLLANLFTEGPTVYAANTAIGDKLESFKDVVTKFNTTFDALAVGLKLRRENLEAAPDYLSTIQTLVGRIAGAWPTIRDWCFWQKVRNEAIALGMGPVIAKLEYPDGESQDLPAYCLGEVSRE